MDGNGSGGKAFAFGPYRVDVMTRRLTKDGGEVHLPNRPFDILVTLIENRDRVVSRTELLDEFWDGHEVYDDALRKCVGSIRKALGDTSKPPEIIETRYGGGYRFIAEVETISKNSRDRDATSRTFASISPMPKRRESSSTTYVGTRFRSIAVVTTILSLVLLTVAFYAFLPRQRDHAAASEPADPIGRIRAIAVMPFKNLTGRPENEYFSDGVTDSLITELARSKEMTVISRGSTFSLKGKEMDPREVGEKLGVDALLEGTVQSKLDAVNIRVRLIDTRDGRILWTSNDFERELSAAYDLQDVIACNVAAELRTELCGTVVNRKTGDGLAYQEYLKGRFEWNKRTSKGIKQSIEHYNRAIEIDPKYALAYSGLSESYLQGIWHVPFNSSEALPKALENALTAIRLDDGLAEAHTALASAYSLQWKWDESDRELARAIELGPRYARAYHVQAFSFMLKGRYVESLAAIDRAAELDPLNLVISTDKANLLLAAGRADDAFRQWERTFAIDPNFVMAREHRLAAYEFVGNDAAAIAENAAIMQSKGEPQAKIAAMREIGNKLGFAAVRRREYGEFLRKDKRGERVSPVTLANYCSLLGDLDGAFSWLEKAFRERRAEIVLIVSPQFAGIRHDPRFRELVDRVGLVSGAVGRDQQ